ncbi:MAG TPA: CHRD domain-containing protein [Candidatus Saccharimonadales bacterium]|nr:CHRD domain-containing protein [Candidatus Saccharimonadales bacterium]
MRLCYGILFACLAAVLALAPLPAGAHERDFYANLTRAQAVPPTGDNTPKGYVVLAFPDGADSIPYYVSYAGLTSDRMSVEIHSGAPGTNGPLLYVLAGPGGTTDDFSGKLYWPAASRPANAIDEFHTYAIVTTASCPNGEIRGHFIEEGKLPAQATTWGRLRRLYGP